MQTSFDENWLDRGSNRAILELFSSDVGLLTGTEPEKDFVDCVNNYLDQKQAGLAARHKAWQLINGACASGVAWEVMKENPATEAYNVLHDQVVNGEYAEVRETLAKKWFTLVEEILLLQFLLQKIKENPEFLAVLIRFFTGLPPRTVAGLKWKDIKQIPNCDNAFHFWVRREIAENGKDLKMFEHLEQFRQVPIAPLLKEALDNRKRAICSSGKLSPRDLAEMPITITDAQIANGDRSHLTTAAIKKLSDEAIDSLQIQDVIVTLPNKEGGREKKSLTKYQGDIFQNNFKSQVRFAGGFLEREANYLCGLQQKATYDRHYCDYTNPSIQRNMYVKLLRWDAVLRNTPPSLSIMSETRALTKKESFSIKGTQTIDIEIPVIGKVTIDVESQNGLDLFAAIVSEADF